MKQSESLARFSKFGFNRLSITREIPQVLGRVLQTGNSAQFTPAAPSPPITSDCVHARKAFRDTRDTSEVRERDIVWDSRIIRLIFERDVSDRANYAWGERL